MNNRKLIMLSIISAGAILAAAIMQKFTPNQSWAAFAGWIIFFLAIRYPGYSFHKTNMVAVLPGLTG